ncbi:MAG: hypothetical protein H6621_06980 [Halobacteriovoraceae bacterium]|nr:hypothetical protein [Halobacteriovoraceae bacterium]
MTKKKQTKFEDKIIEERYKKRFSSAKIGKACYKRGDAAGMVGYYNGYLKAIGDFHSVDPMKLKPSVFEGNSAVSERILVSQIYYELARVYDMKSEDTYVKRTQQCLDQFAIFTVNQPYQNINSEMLRVHLKTTNFRNKEMFRETLKKIYSKSSTCFIATYCYSSSSPVTQEFRQFRNSTMNKPWGFALYRYYYAHSPYIVNFLENYPRLGNILKYSFIKPILYALHLLLRLIPYEYYR